jgi:hypothetical protein
MARIPDEELERIKSQVDLADLCRDYGIELKRMGPDNLMGRCPFHEDHTPSFGVTPSKNLWNCLAGCGGGDVIQLVMRKEEVSFRHAVEVLRGRLGIAPMAAPTLKTRAGTTHPPDDVDAHPAGASPFGVLDLVGNVWQWTDEFQDPQTRAAVLRGGSSYRLTGSKWYFPRSADLMTHGKLLLMAPGKDRSAMIGFRCVVDAE